MRREVIWRTEDGIGAEHLFLTGGDGGFVADSIVFATREVEPSRTHYRVELDPDWSVRRVSLTVAKAGEPARSLELVSDGRGHWHDRHGTVLPDFAIGTAVAAAAGAVSFGVALGIGQLFFAVALVWVLLRA